ncbi:MAG: TVP38/TMEM64 family protein [Desulfomonilia bacterium]
MERYTRFPEITRALAQALQAIRTVRRKISRGLDWYIRMINTPSPVRRGLSLTALLTIAFLSLLGLFKIIDPYPLQSWIYLRLTLQDFGLISAFIFISMIAVFPLASPLSLFIMTGSAVYGPPLGMALSYAGAILNANVVFFLIKALAIDKTWGYDKQTFRYKSMIKRNGYQLVLVLQLISIIPFTAINSGAAAAGIRWRDFMKATLIGVMPSIVIYSLLGDIVVERFFSPQIYFAFIGMVALSIIMVAINKKNVQRGGKRFF